MCDPAVPETLLFVGEIAVFSRWCNFNIEKKKKKREKGLCGQILKWKTDIINTAWRCSHTQEWKHFSCVVQNKRWHPFCLKPMLFHSGSEPEAVHFRPCFVSPWDAGDSMKSGPVCPKRHGQRGAYLCSDTRGSYGLSGLANNVMFQIADSHG